MALSGIGGNGGGSALDRFQKLRDAAQKKLESSERQAGLAELIQRKQRQLGAGAAIPEPAKSQAERIPPGLGGLGGSAARANAEASGGTPGVSPAYGRSGAPRKQDAAPRLGRYVDFMA